MRWTESTAATGVPEPAANWTTAASALLAGAARLRAAGVPDARGDARLLMAQAMGLCREALIALPRRSLGAAESAAFARAIARRAAREPVSRILGRREFWSLEFRLTPDCFDPRPDSETVVAAVLDRVARRLAPLSLLDLGTGTGCLLLALLSELPNAWGLGIDSNLGAIRSARENAEALGLGPRARFVTGDWGSGVRAAFNVVVSNPPYIRQDEIAGLPAEVARFEPYRALAGGADGLGAFRALAPDVARLLAEDGTAAIEIGAGQEDKAAAILRRAGLMVEARCRDLSGIVRCLVVAK